MNLQNYLANLLWDKVGNELMGKNAFEKTKLPSTASIILNSHALKSYAVGNQLVFFL